MITIVQCKDGRRYGFAFDAKMNAKIKKNGKVRFEPYAGVTAMPRLSSRRQPSRLRTPMSRTHTSDDRTVHAKYTIDREVFYVVRYNRAGKWYIESLLRRRQVTIGEAVETVVKLNAQVFWHMPGGTSFDAKLRKAGLADD